MATKVNDKILDDLIGRSVMLEGLKKTEVNRMVRFLNNDIIPDARSLLATRLNRIRAKGLSSGVFRTKQLRELLAAYDVLITRGVQEMKGSLKKSLRTLGMTESQWAKKSLQASLPIDIALGLPTADRLNSILNAKPFQGKFLNTWWNELSRSIKTRTKQQLQIGLANGESTQAITRRLLPVLDKSRRDVATITRTAINHVGTQARELTYKANQDVIKAVQWVSVLDGRTTLICISLDGKKFPVDSGQRPPAHMNCRSIVTPVTKSWRELGIDKDELTASTRASMDGQVPSKTTYSEWLRGKPQKFQEDVLGVGRAKLWRDGKITVDKFVTADLKTVPLSKLSGGRTTGELLSDQRVLSAPPSRFKKNSPEDFEFVFDNPENQITWHKKIIKQFNSGKPMPEKWGTRPGRAEFWQWLDDKAVAGKTTKTKPVTPVTVTTPKKAQGFKTTKDWIANLDKDAKDAIFEWTHQDMDDFDIIRNMQLKTKGFNRGFDLIRRRLAGVNKALKTAPSYEGQAFRGMQNLKKADIDALLKSDTIAMDTLSSFSRHKKIALDFAKGQGWSGDNVLFHTKFAKAGGGVDIRDLSAQFKHGEIIAGKGTKFKVTRHWTEQVGRGGKVTLHHFELEEIVAKAAKAVPNTATMNGQELVAHLKKTYVDDITGLRAKAQKKFDETTRKLNEIWNTPADTPGRHDLELLWLRNNKVAIKELFDIDNTINTRIHKDLAVTNKMSTINPNFIGFKPKKEFLGRYNTANKFIEDVTDKAALGERLDINVNMVRTNRESYSSSTNTVHFANSTDTTTIVHELIHQFEYISKEISDKTHGWLRYRTIGHSPENSVQTLRKITGSNGYKPSEVARADKFMHPYIGKDYGRVSSEMLTMGVQYLYENPMKFLREDPDMFEAIINILRGRKLRKSATEDSFLAAKLNSDFQKGTYANPKSRVFKTSDPAILSQPKAPVKIKSGTEWEAVNEWIKLNTKGMRKAESANKFTGTIGKKAKLFNEILDTMPKVKGEIFRGGAFTTKDAFGKKMKKALTTKGSVIKLNNSLSASHSRTVAQDALRMNGYSTFDLSGVDAYILKIKSKTGADLGPSLRGTGFASEKEVIMRSGTSYRVIKVEKITGMKAKINNTTNKRFKIPNVVEITLQEL